MSVATRSIPLVDLRAQYQALRDELLPEIEAVLEGMQLLLGPNTRAFERDFAAYCGANHALTVSNGTDALHVALRACGIGGGDEVITVANTFVATVEAIEMSGARAVLVDIDPRTGTLDPDQVEAAISPRTRAVLPVHLYGHPADLDPLLEIARRHNLRLIEDTAQAHGAEYRGRRLGGIGDIGCFSFYYSKNLGAYGEGGGVVTSDSDLAERMRLLRDHGSPEKYRHSTFGFNARGDELQSAVLKVKLRYLDGWNARRRELAAFYTDGLADLDLRPPFTADWATPVFHLYAIHTPRRDALLDHLRSRGIGAGIHYPIPIHQQEGYRHVIIGPGGLANAERWAAETLSLPIYPELSDDDAGYVVETVREFFAS